MAYTTGNIQSAYRKVLQNPYYPYSVEDMYRKVNGQPFYSYNFNRTADQVFGWPFQGGRLQTKLIKRRPQDLFHGVGPSVEPRGTHIRHTSAYPHTMYSAPIYGFGGGDPKFNPRPVM